MLDRAACKGADCNECHVFAACAAAHQRHTRIAAARAPSQVNVLTASTPLRCAGTRGSLKQEHMYTTPLQSASTQHACSSSRAQATSLQLRTPAVAHPSHATSMLATYTIRFATLNQNIRERRGGHETRCVQARPPPGPAPDLPLRGAGGRPAAPRWCARRTSPRLIMTHPASRRTFHAASEHFTGRICTRTCGHRCGSFEQKFHEISGFFSGK